jgi:hypothetical protein
VKVKEECERSAIEGGLYVFFSRSRDRVRIFYWDLDGYATWTKRLEAGSFKIGHDVNGYEVMTAIDLEGILSGMELSRIRVRKTVENGLRL